jgi:hypothetical protein
METGLPDPVGAGRTAGREVRGTTAVRLPPGRAIGRSWSSSFLGLAGAGGRPASPTEGEVKR